MSFYPNAKKYLQDNKQGLINSSVEKRNGKRAWEILFRARTTDLFKSPKIIFRQTGDSPICVIDNDKEYFCIDSLNVMQPNSKYVNQLIYFMILINSKLCKFYYQEISQESGRVLAQVKPQRLKRLPIIIKDEYVLAIESEYEQYIINKNNHHLHNIDLMIYKLFNLDYQDILIIDPDFGLTEAEYTNFELEKVK